MHPFLTAAAHARMPCVQQGLAERQGDGNDVSRNTDARYSLAETELPTHLPSRAQPVPSVTPCRFSTLTCNKFPPVRTHQTHVNIIHVSSSGTYTVISQFALVVDQERTALGKFETFTRGFHPRT